MTINRVYKTTNGKDFGVRFRLSNVLFTSCSDEMLKKIQAAAEAWIRESRAQGSHDHLAYRYHNDIISRITDILSKRLVGSLMQEIRKTNESKMSSSIVAEILQLGAPALLECMGKNSTNYTFTYCGYQLPFYQCHPMVLRKLKKVIIDEISNGEKSPHVSMLSMMSYYEGAIEAIEAVPVIQ